jgi:hypothetical protein
MRTKLLYPLYSFFQRNDAAFYVRKYFFSNAGAYAGLVYHFAAVPFVKGMKVFMKEARHIRKKPPAE